MDTVYYIEVDWLEKSFYLENYVVNGRKVGENLKREIVEQSPWIILENVYT